MCSKCRKPLTHSAGLEYCEACGYETPESERRPVVIPNDNDRAGGRPMTTAKALARRTTDDGER